MKKALETPTRSSEQIRRTSLQVRLSEVASLCVLTAVPFCHVVRCTEIQLVSILVFFKKYKNMQHRFISVSCTIGII